MKLTLMSVMLVCIQAAAWNTTVELHDETRKSLFHPSGRAITAIVCGADTSSESLPLYVFAHGFDCFAPDYEWLCFTPGVVTAIVVSSDIIPFVPDTKDLALDQAFLSVALPAMANQKDSPLFGKLSGKAVLGGHSMGGGTSVLAADKAFVQKAQVDAVALLAPGLYTKPAGYSHMAAIQAPVLIVSGAMDCGPNALPKQAQPLYGNVSSTTKALVVLRGANHCQWTSATRGVCAKAECHDLNQDAQQSAGRELIASFILATVGGGSWAAFEDELSKGQQALRWEYITMLSSSGANITNSCPC